MTEPVVLQRIAAVAHIRLARPERMNAVDIPVGRAFLACCQEAAADPTVRAVLVTGDGKAFGVGGDLSLLVDDPVGIAPGLIGPMHDALACIGEMAKPVVAAVHGVVFGGSFSVAMGCDLVVAAEGSRFNLAYVNIGASCDGGASWTLPRLTGMRNAMAIAMLGDELDAQEALRLGLINRVVPAGTHVEEGLRLATRLSAAPTQAIGRMKRLIRGAHLRDFSAQLNLERDVFVDNAATDDFRAGLQGFISKQKPVFNGR